MNIEDKMGNKITLFQAKNGSIQMVFGDKSVDLKLTQIEKLFLDSRLYDIEDFNIDDYKKYYNFQPYEQIKRRNYLGIN